VLVRQLTAKDSDEPGILCREARLLGEARICRDTRILRRDIVQNAICAEERQKAFQSCSGGTSRI